MELASGGDGYTSGSIASASERIPFTAMYLGVRYGPETATGFELADQATPLTDQPSVEPLVHQPLEPLVARGEELRRVVEHQLLAAIDESGRHPAP